MAQRKAPTRFQVGARRRGASFAPAGSEYETAFLVSVDFGPCGCSPGANAGVASQSPAPLGQGPGAGGWWVRGRGGTLLREDLRTRQHQHYRIEPPRPKAIDIRPTSQLPRRQPTCERPYMNITVRSRKARQPRSPLLSLARCLQTRGGGFLLIAG